MCGCCCHGQTWHAGTAICWMLYKARRNQFIWKLFMSLSYLYSLVHVFLEYFWSVQSSSVKCTKNITTTNSTLKSLIISSRWAAQQMSSPAWLIFLGFLLDSVLYVLSIANFILLFDNMPIFSLLFSHFLCVRLWLSDLATLKYKHF